MQTSSNRDTQSPSRFPEENTAISCVQVAREERAPPALVLWTPGATVFLTKTSHWKCVQQMGEEHCNRGSDAGA